MNKKVFRLKKGYEIKKAIKKGAWKSESRVIVYIRQNNIQKHYNRTAVCVSKKNGNSVQRNKLKRYVREANRILIENRYLNKDIVIILKKTTNINNTKYSDIYDDLKHAYDNIK